MHLSIRFPGVISHIGQVYLDSRVKERGESENIGKDNAIKGRSNTGGQKREKIRWGGQ